MRMMTMWFLLATIMLCDAVARAESLADQFKSQRDEKLKNYDRDMAVIDEASKLYRNIEAHGKSLVLDDTRLRGEVFLVRDAIIRFEPSNFDYPSARNIEICGSRNHSSAYLEVTPEVLSIAKDDIFEFKYRGDPYEVNLRAGTCFYQFSPYPVKKCRATLKPISLEYSYLQYRLKTAREHCARFYKDMR
jgi:hypothetical protein